MEQAVKQRLVGAVVLAAIAVVTLPMVFNAEREPGVQVPETVPSVPEFPPVTMPEPKPVALPPDRPSSEPVPVADMYSMGNDQPTDAADEEAPPANTLSSSTSSNSTTANGKPPVSPAKPGAASSTAATAASKSIPPLPAAPGGKLNAAGIPESWVVQVAAMTDQTKIDSLVASLKLNGYPVFTRVTQDEKGRTTRIYIGPKLDKAHAQQIKQKVDREQKLQTMVKPFQP